MNIPKQKRFVGLSLLLMGPSVLFGELVFETDEISLTLPPNKDRLSVEFPFKVGGELPVTIKEYQAACSCLSAEISGNGKLTWNPGESGVVRGNFKLGTIKGAIEKKIVITLEGEPNPIVLTAKLEIPDLFSIDPPTLFWDLDGKGKTQIFKIRVNHETDIMVTDISCTNEQFKYDLEVVKPGREYQVAVTPVHVAERAFGLLRVKNDCEFKKYSSVQGFMVVRVPKPSD
ncbi:MAG: DUF1573 domain-containing protein [Roseibacillus sp.]|jgi:hypothetical protein|nr:DUF1573 domain-containing protein [Roseibacillus sp.]